MVAQRMKSYSLLAITGLIAGLASCSTTTAPSDVKADIVFRGMSQDQIIVPTVLDPLCSVMRIMIYPVDGPIFERDYPFGDRQALVSVDPGIAEIMLHGINDNNRVICGTSLPRVDLVGGRNEVEIPPMRPLWIEESPNVIIRYPDGWVPVATSLSTRAKFKPSPSQEFPFLSFDVLQVSTSGEVDEQLVGIISGIQAVSSVVFHDSVRVGLIDGTEVAFCTYTLQTTPAERHNRILFKDSGRNAMFTLAVLDSDFINNASTRTIFENMRDLISINN